MRFTVLFCALALSACGTITRGTTDQVQILSDPSDAEVRTSLGHSCRTPCSLTISRKDEFVVTFSKDGYEPRQVPVIIEISGAGGAAFAGNILLGGVVGMGADAATGAAYNHTPNPVSVTLDPIKSEVAPVAAHVRGKRGGRKGNV